MPMRFAPEFTQGSPRFRSGPATRWGTRLGLLLTAPIIKLKLQITTSRQDMTSP
jgi:hypothetical protein